MKISLIYQTFSGIAPRGPLDSEAVSESTGAPFDVLRTVL